MLWVALCLDLQGLTVILAGYCTVPRYHGRLLANTAVNGILCRIVNKTLVLRHVVAQPSVTVLTGWLLL
jgi:hypothetical protein